MTETNLTVTLSAIDNHDYPAPRDAIRHMEPRVVKVASLADAVRVCAAYIREHDLGGGHWSGGLVQRDGASIGHVAYNGRFIVQPS